MAMLNEYCLNHIFGYLSPVEWIQIGKVCQIWKTTVTRQWKRMTAISYEVYCTLRDRYGENNKLPDLITVSDAKKILLQSARFCQVLKPSATNEGKVIALMLGPFVYRVANFNPDHTLKLFVENATEITHIWLVYQQTNMNLLRLLFKNNNIKTLVINADSRFLANFLQYIPTAGIEDLFLYFNEPNDNRKLFKRYFPDLQSLTIETNSWDYSSPYDFQPIISKILPYVLGIKLLTLRISQYYVTNGFLKHVAKLSQLEELELIFTCDREDAPKFNLKFETCPNLRFVSLDEFNVTNFGVKSLLSLPNLKRLDLENSWSRFTFKQELPEMKELTEFSISFVDSAHLNIKTLCSAVKKMPALQNLRVGGLSKKQNLMLVSEASVFATSLGKDVLITERASFGKNHWKLKLESGKNIKEVDVPTLILNVGYCYAKTFFDDVMNFVQKSLKEYRVVVLEDNRDQPVHFWKEL